MLLLSAIFLHLCVAINAGDWITDKRTGKQYKMMSTPNNLVYDDLQEACSNVGGFLPEPRDSQENKFVYEVAPGVVIVLGMTDRLVENQWVWKSDQTPVTWLNWRAGEPNNFRGPEHCVMIVQEFLKGENHDPKKWADIPCQPDKWINTLQMGLVCQRNPEDYWKTDKRTGKQYTVMDTPDDLVHDDLKQVCHDLGGFLPEPKDSQENQFLNGLTKGVIALGMRLSGGQWIWESDASPVNWLNWLSGEPDNYRPPENCAMMVKELLGGRPNHDPKQWADIPCQSDGWIRGQQLSLVCQRHQDS